MSEFITINCKQGYVMAHYTQVKVIKINGVITVYVQNDEGLTLDSSSEIELIEALNSFRMKK